MLRYVSLVCSAAFLISCANNPARPIADAPVATVVTRDGARVAGKLVESSAKQVTVALPDNTTRTIPMAQVKRIDYAEAPPAPAGGVPMAAGAPLETPHE